MVRDSNLFLFNSKYCHPLPYEKLDESCMHHDLNGTLHDYFKRGVNLTEYPYVSDQLYQALRLFRALLSILTFLTSFMNLTIHE